MTWHDEDRMSRLPHEILCMFAQIGYNFVYERIVEADFRITAAGSLDAMHAAQQATFVLICAFVGTKAVEVCLKMVNNTN